MKQLALEALDAALHARRHLRRRPRHRNRANAKSPPRTARPATSPAPNRMGVGIRVLADGCWGFAATDDLTHEGIEAAAALALEIARAGALAKKHDVALAPEDKYEADLGLAHPHRSVHHSGRPEPRASCSPIDSELRRNPGVSLAEGVHALRAPAAGVRLHARQPDRSDPLPSAAPDSRRSATRTARFRSAPIPIPSAASIS